MKKIRLSVAVVALVLIAVAPDRARAQHVDPLQAAAIAEGVVGMIFGPMYPTPQCGPHDAPPPQPYRYQPGMPSYGQPRPYQPMTPSYSQPQPYQPTSPSYAQPQPYQQPMLSDDDDDGEYQVLQPRLDRRAANDGDQNQNRPALEDGSGQPVQSDQAGYRPADGEDSGQVRVAPRRSSRRHQRTQDSGATQSGQVAEIPSQPSVTRAYRPQSEQ
jgi:hypothetical protein